MSEAKTDKATPVSKESLLEAYASDPERVALRREELEAVSQRNLRNQHQVAIIEFHDQLKHDTRAIDTSTPEDRGDKWQVTLPADEHGNSLTIQSNKEYIGSYLPLIHIYNGIASEALQADPTLQFDPTDETYHDIVSMGAQHAGFNTNGGVNAAIAGKSIKDMQGLVSDILLVEALAEQFTPTHAPDVAAQAGKIAVQPRP